MAYELLPTIEEQKLAREMLIKTMTDMNALYRDLKQAALAPSSGGAIPPAEKIKITGGFTFRPFTITITVEF